MSGLPNTVSPHSRTEANPATTVGGRKEVLVSLSAVPLDGKSTEESLVTDARASLTPAQMVERKLFSLLRSNPLPMSHVQLSSVVRPRGH